MTGGNPKTDIIVDIQVNNSTLQLPISIKQTTASKVAMAELMSKLLLKKLELPTIF